MNRQHVVILSALKQHARKQRHHQTSDSYLGSGHFYHDVSVPDRRAIAKSWLKENRAIAHGEFVVVVDSLMRARSHEEKTTAAILLAYHPAGRKTVTLKKLDRWLDHLSGWAEIDSLCSNVFTAGEMLADWKDWSGFIGKLARSKNINKCRAALVFLTGPVRYSADERLLQLGFKIIDLVKRERDILITKAVSWLLRSLALRHRRAVADYVADNRAALPAIAVRETLRKIKTGRK